MKKKKKRDLKKFSHRLLWLKSQQDQDGLILSPAKRLPFVQYNYCNGGNPPPLPLRLASFKFTSSSATRCGSGQLRARSVSCCVGTGEETRQVTVSNRNDSLEICRVLNGMWQTSGGWGRIDRDDAVEAMLQYSDAGLTTFDMADHCLYI